MHPDKERLMFKSSTVTTTTTLKSNPMIIVTAYWGEIEVGKEEYQPGTKFDHIMEGMIKKYGQVARFVLSIPPVWAKD